MNVFAPTIIARKGLYFTASLIDKLQSRSLNGPVVLCYHSFGSDKWLHGVSVKNFERQVKFLIENYKHMSVAQLKDVLNGKKFDMSNYFLITIDDGYQDVLSVKNILKTYNIKPILFLLSDRKRLDRTEMANEKPLLANSEIKQLVADGWILGSHGETHSNFYTLSDISQNDEVIKSKTDLEKMFKQKIKYFAYPKGRYTNQILAKVKKAGYEMAFSMDDGFINKKTDKYVIPRIGVNRTHSITEFEQMMSPLSVQVRGFIKNTLKGVVI